MNASASSSEAAADNSLSDAEPSTHIGVDAKKIKASIVRLTGNSIDGLQELSSELKNLQAFLTSEVERVQGELESVMAGIDIIIETIAPWKEQAPFVRGPAANINPYGFASTSPGRSFSTTSLRTNVRT
jgi:hypothetical protein